MYHGHLDGQSFIHSNSLYGGDVGGHNRHSRTTGSHHNRHILRSHRSHDDDDDVDQLLVMDQAQPRELQIPSIPLPQIERTKLPIGKNKLFHLFSTKQNNKNPKIVEALG